MATADIYFEVTRRRRRPRYHQGARADDGQVFKPEQCNLDQVTGAVHVLDELPVIRNPRSQLCRRCLPALRAELGA